MGSKKSKGVDRYDDKEKRKVRRHNHIARDLRTPKFKQRIVEGKPRTPPPEIEDWDWIEEEDVHDE